MNQTFTRGPVRTRAAETYNAIEIESQEGNICKVYGTALSDNPMHPMNQLRNINASLIVAAFNSATACADMGFDGIKAVEVLPKLLEAARDALTLLESLYSDGCPNIPQLKAALTQAGQLTKAQQNALAVGEQKPRW